MKAGNARRFNERDHRLLALWAADCAEHVLSYFEEHAPEDNRPREALEAARAWARGELAMTRAREAAFAAHAAARAADHPVAIAAARAAGHAAATAHVADHAAHAAAYAIKTVRADAVPADAAVAEREWQVRRLPEHLHWVAFSPSIH